MKKVFTISLLLFLIANVQAQFGISTFAKTLNDFVVIFENDTSGQIVRPSVMPKFGTNGVGWTASVLYSNYITGGLNYPEEALKQHIRSNIK